MSSSNLRSIQREEDYLLSPPWIRKSFSSIRSLKDSVSLVEIFDFIPYTFQELEPAVERGPSLAATGQTGQEANPVPKASPLHSQHLRLFAGEIGVVAQTFQASLIMRDQAMYKV